MQWYQWWYCPYYMMVTSIQWHHMAPTSVPVASCVASYNKKESHITPYFNYLNLWNVVVPVIMLLLWYDTDASANGIVWWKNNVGSDFHCVDGRNTVVLFLIPLVSCDANKVPVLDLIFSYHQDWKILKFISEAYTWWNMIDPPSMTDWDLT